VAIAIVSERQWLIFVQSSFQVLFIRIYSIHKSLFFYVKKAHDNLKVYQAALFTLNSFYSNLQSVQNMKTEVLPLALYKDEEIFIMATRISRTQYIAWMISNLVYGLSYLEVAAINAKMAYRNYNGATVWMWHFVNMYQYLFEPVSNMMA